MLSIKNMRQITLMHVQRYMLNIVKSVVIRKMQNGLENLLRQIEDVSLEAALV